MRSVFVSAQALLIFVFCAISVLGASGRMNSMWPESAFLLMPLLAFVGSVYAVNRYSLKSVHGRSLFLLSMGMGTAFLAEIFSFIEGNFLRKNIPFSSSGIIFVLSFLFLIAGLIMEISAGKIVISAKKIWSFIAVFSFASAVIFYFQIISFHERGDVLFSIHSFIDIILLFTSLLIVTIAFEYEKGKMFLPWLILGIGCIMMLLGDILLGFFSDVYKQIAVAKIVVDLFWFFSYSMFSLGMFSFGFMLDDESEMLMEKMKLEKAEETV